MNSINLPWSAALVTLNPFDDPFYYLTNFEQALAWLAERYGDLLVAEELDFICAFGQLPKPSRALLVRLIMRKGVHFRQGKLSYAEIPEVAEAAAPLIDLGWLDCHAPLTLDALFALLQKAEIVQVFKASIPHATLKKTALFEALAPLFPQAQPFDQWCPALAEQLLTLTLRPLCDRLRLMYFGNLYQDWSEFVLADLGVLSYEKVEFSAQSRGLRSRADIDAYLYLQACREAFESAVPVAEVLRLIESFGTDNPWLERRRDKLLFQLGQHCERQADWPTARAIYSACVYREARVRLIRVLEREGEYGAALALAEQAEQAPHNAAEYQQVQRQLPRLQRKLGQMPRARSAVRPVERLDLELVLCESPLSVEQRVQQHLDEARGPVHYVENGLINSLFGLLCWPAIFAPLPGAFFHPFQSGPVDLLSDDFYPQRAELFANCLAELADGRYRQTISERFKSKYGLQSPFVFWRLLSDELLEQALDCLPAAHLQLWFLRLLEDIKANRAGMPDLIQFWPGQHRYRMIEVKGPGDRLQDNQLRWLEFCATHGMPVTVCYVRWTPPCP